MGVTCLINNAGVFLGGEDDPLKGTPGCLWPSGANGEQPGCLASRPVARCKLQDQHVHVLHWLPVEEGACVLTCPYENAPCRQARGL